MVLCKLSECNLTRPKNIPCFQHIYFLYSYLGIHLKSINTSISLEKLILVIVYEKFQKVQWKKLNVEM